MQYGYYGYECNIVAMVMNAIWLQMQYGCYGYECNMVAMVTNAKWLLVTMVMNGNTSMLLQLPPIT